MGAATLVMAGASASGCGSVQAALPEQLAATFWSQAPQVVLGHRLSCGPAGDLELAALAEQDAGRLDAIVLGPGLGRGGGGGGDGQAWEWLRQFEGLLVLDADGLNRLARMGDAAIPWLDQRRGPTWLTPHQGEFARLFPRFAELPPLEAAAGAAQACGAAVLLKGARTVVAGPADGGSAARWQLRTAATAAARAGLGDVLAGYAGGVGAMAMACGNGAPASLLAAIALAHACAGARLAQQGPGCASPPAVAASLATTGPATT